jgi:hypothetical protein
MLRAFRTPLGSCVPVIATLVIGALLTWAAPARAVWPHDASATVPVCTAVNNQTNVVAVSDGKGGAIFAWLDQRGGAGTDIYVQRLNSQGVPQWTDNGVALCTAISTQDNLVIVSDGQGGAYVVWRDFRGSSPDIYAARVLTDGALPWTANGVAVCTPDAVQQIAPAATLDAQGFLVVAWQDLRPGATYDIYAQRLNSSGVVQWAASGAPVCTAPNHQQVPTICADLSGGTFIAWTDDRALIGPDIMADRILSTGASGWVTNGSVVCNASGTQSAPQLVPDGSGGGIVAWIDNRATGEDVYAQRFNASSTMLWVANGLALCTATNTQAAPRAISDGLGGAIVTWLDNRGATPSDLYAQRVTQAGAIQWTANGVLIQDAPVALGNVPQQIVSDRQGGAIIAWSEDRYGDDDLFLQRVSASGSLMWGAGGQVAITSPFAKVNSAMASDGLGGAIVAVAELVTTSDIKAKAVDRYGIFGADPAVTNVEDVPNDQGGKVKVSWNASALDTDPAFFTITQYHLFRSVPPLIAQAALASGMGTMMEGDAPLKGRRAFATTSQGPSVYYWEYLASQSAYQLPSYSFVASTSGDSVDGSNPLTAYMVQARTATNQFWNSQPDSGYSTDDLAPVAPAPLTGHYSGGTTALHWNPNPEPDLAEYRLYRGLSAGFTPGPGNFVAAVPDTGYVDSNAAQPYYYKLGAVDSHGNVSPYALLTPSGTVDASLPGAVARMWLAAPTPNPVVGEAAFRFGIAATGPVTLRIYDASGRVVRDLLSGVLPQGEHSMRWNGRDEAGRSVAGGIYFARLSAGGETRIARVIAMR